jgi:hypothetical protein
MASNLKAASRERGGKKSREKHSTHHTEMAQFQFIPSPTRHECSYREQPESSAYAGQETSTGAHRAEEPGRQQRGNKQTSTARIRAHRRSCSYLVRHGGGARMSRRSVTVLVPRRLRAPGWRLPRECVRARGQSKESEGCRRRGGRWVRRFKTGA